MLLIASICPVAIVHHGMNLKHGTYETMTKFLQKTNHDMNIGQYT